MNTDNGLAFTHGLTNLPPSAGQAGGLVKTGLHLNMNEQRSFNPHGLDGDASVQGWSADKTSHPILEILGAGNEENAAGIPKRGFRRLKSWLILSFS